MTKTPNIVEGTVAYTEGVAAMHFDNERANRTIAKYARLRDPKKIDEIYQNSVIYPERRRRVEPESIKLYSRFYGQTRRVAGDVR